MSTLSTEAPVPTQQQGTPPGAEHLAGNGPAPQPAPTGDAFFSQADVNAAVQKAVEAARSQEKDKLYGRIESLSTDLQTLTQAREAEDKARQEEAQAAAEAQEAARKAQEAEELSAKDLLAKREIEWAEAQKKQQEDNDRRFAEFQQQQELAQAALQKDRQLAELTAYTQQRLALEADNIAPQFIDFVSGNSPEEIDRSIEIVKAKSQEIIGEFQNIQGSQQIPAPQPRGVSPYGYTPSGPAEQVQGGTQQYTVQDIQNMDMATYAEFRKNLNTGGNTSGGLFG